MAFAISAAFSDATTKAPTFVEPIIAASTRATLKMQNMASLNLVDYRTCSAFHVCCDHAEF